MFCLILHLYHKAQFSLCVFLFSFLFLFECVWVCVCVCVCVCVSVCLCVCARARVSACGPNSSKTTGRTNIKLGKIDHHPGVSVIRGLMST